MSAATRKTACLDRLRPVSSAKALHQLRNHLPALAGERLATFWIRQSTLETAFKLCRDSLSQWSWIWRQPQAYVRLWRASRCLTRSRRLTHNHRFRTRLESLPALAALNDAHAVRRGQSDLLSGGTAVRRVRREAARLVRPPRTPSGRAATGPRSGHRQRPPRRPPLVRPH